MADNLPMVNSLGRKMRDKRYQPEKQTSENNQKYKPTPRAQRYNAKEAPKKSPEKDTTFKPAKARAQHYQPKQAPTPSQFFTNMEFSFQAVIESNTALIFCSKISNLSQDQEIEEVPEGGNNIGPNIFLAPKKKPDVLRIEHGICPDISTIPLQTGMIVSNGLITVYRDGKGVMSLAFSRGIITKSNFTDLDAMGGQIMVQTLEITHDGLEYLPNG